METYISILRGINLGGHNTIKMEALKSLLSKCGFKNVQTYIQSGNVVYQFESIAAKQLDILIQDKIREQFMLEVPVITMTVDELKTVANCNPFSKDKEKDVSFFHITYLSDEPQADHLNKTMDLKYPPDEFVIIGKAVYLYCPNGYGKTKLSNKFLESKLKVAGTTRNWKTTNELILIADKF
jgi:uncharacterized protein (DUF1697 family)